VIWTCWTITIPDDLTRHPGVQLLPPRDCQEGSTAASSTPSVASSSLPPQANERRTHGRVRGGRGPSPMSRAAAANRTPALQIKHFLTVRRTHTRPRKDPPPRSDRLTTAGSGMTRSKSGSTRLGASSPLRPLSGSAGRGLWAPTGGGHGRLVGRPSPHCVWRSR
jgi:hypothetical protein